MREKTKKQRKGAASLSPEGPLLKTRLPGPSIFRSISAVEKPGRKIRSMISDRDRVRAASGSTVAPPKQEFCRALRYVSRIVWPLEGASCSKTHACSLMSP